MTFPATVQDIKVDLLGVVFAAEVGPQGGEARPRFGVERRHVVLLDLPIR